VLGSLFAGGLVDEIHAFTAAKILGGPGDSLPTLPDPPPVEVEEILHPGGDILIRGLVRRPGAASTHPG
jgi:riboflavin biosynthesis pyrimidine reductase